jgi:hypothetical protein
MFHRKGALVGRQTQTNRFISLPKEPYRQLFWYSKGTKRSDYQKQSIIQGSHSVRISILNEIINVSLHKKQHWYADELIKNTERATKTNAYPQISKLKPSIINKHLIHPCSNFSIKQIPSYLGIKHNHTYPVISKSLWTWFFKWRYTKQYHKTNNKPLKDGMKI